MADESITDRGRVVCLGSLEGFNRSGVYFLYRDGVVVYVGQAVDVRRRIGSHIGEGTKRFDAVSFMPCRPANLLRTEKLYIERLMPEYNKACNPAFLNGQQCGTESPTPFTRSTYSPAEAAELLGLQRDELASLGKLGILRPKRASRSRDRVYHAIDLHEYQSRKSG